MCACVLEYNLKRAAVLTGKKFQSVTQTMYHINQKNDLCVPVIVITACALQQSNNSRSRLLQVAQLWQRDCASSGKSAGKRRD